MSSPYRIKTILAEDGERLPFLLDGETGMPLFNPTVYVLTEVRMRNRAVNTIKAHLAAIEAMLIHLRTTGIDLCAGRAAGW